MQIFELATGIPGNTLEVGCFKGLSSWLLCNAMTANDESFKGDGHTIVDSFEGLSTPVKQDRVGPEFQDRFSDTSVDHVSRTLTDFLNILIVKGWAPEAFEALPERSYRFVHIDVDLYDPTRDSLSYLYSRMSLGGFLVIDDFGLWRQVWRLHKSCH